MKHDIEFKASLKETLDKVLKLSDQEFELFASIWEKVEIPKKTMITQIEQQEEYLYFILSGLQRVFYYDQYDREATIVFTYSSSFGGVIDSFITRTASKYYYETLTDTVLFKASYKNLSQIKASSNAITNIIEQFLGLTISGLLDRLVEMQCFTAEEKFKALFSRSPHILNLVPQKYLANYIGIDHTNFSKFINRIRI